MEICKLYKDPNLTEEIEHLFYFEKSNSKEGEELDKDFLKKICIVGIPLLIIIFIVKWLRKESTLLESICWSSIIFLIIKIIVDYISKWTLLRKLKTILNKIDIITIGDFNIKDIIPTIKISQTISEEKIFSWEQFENLFKILIWKKAANKQFLEIEKITKKTKLFKNKKILLIFDNIDRCESNTVKEILMTIKTFLNQNNCIFLLPIDYENICKSYENYDQWNEYLRKIFNLWINIKRPYYDKFSELISQLMKNNWWMGKWDKWLNLEDSEAKQISYILSSVFTDNPRKIKQFLNQLWAEFILHNKEKNILSILKELIIQVEIPKLYKYLLEDQNIIFANEILYEFSSGKRNFEGNDALKWRDLILLHKLWWIEEELELFDDENIKIRKSYNQTPEIFIQVIKKDGLKKQAESFLLSNIESVREGWTQAQKDFFERSIYFMSEFWIVDILYNGIFKRWDKYLCLL